MRQQRLGLYCGSARHLQRLLLTARAAQVPTAASSGSARGRLRTQLPTRLPRSRRHSRSSRNPRGRGSRRRPRATAPQAAAANLLRSNGLLMAAALAAWPSLQPTCGACHLRSCALGAAATQACPPAPSQQRRGMPPAVLQQQLQEASCRGQATWRETMQQQPALQHPHHHPAALKPSQLRRQQWPLSRAGSTARRLRQPAGRPVPWTTQSRTAGWAGCSAWVGARRRLQGNVTPMCSIALANNAG